jgi:MFS family permease
MLEDFRGIPSSARLIVVGTFFSQLSVGTVLTDLAFFLTTVRHLDAVFVGLVLTVEGISSVILSIPLGILSDVRGRKWFLVVGNVSIGIAVIMLAIFTNAPLLLVAGLLGGVSEAAFTASTGALLADVVREEKRTATFALASLSSNLAFAGGGFLLYLIAPLTNLGITETHAHQVLYIALALLTLLSTSLFIRVREVRVKDTKERRSRPFLISSSTRSVLVRYVVANLFVAFGAGLFVPLMSQWFEYKYGIPDTVSGPILGISNLMLAISTIAAPSVARRLGIVKTIVYTQGASTLFMVLTPLSPVYQIAGTLFVIRSFLMNVSSPLSQSLIMGLVPQKERGAASGISSAFWRTPNAISTYPGSALMKQGYLSEPFYIASALYIISISLFYRWFKGSGLPHNGQRVT